MTSAEREAIALTCIAAACADGHLGADERRRIQHVVDELGLGDRDLFRRALTHPVGPETVGRMIVSPDARRTAYHAALLVCEADGVLTEPEEAFLGRLQAALQLSDAAASGMRLEAERFVEPGLPPVAPMGDPSEAADDAILRYAMMAGAAELLPQSIATVLVIPLQLKMVYEIGRRHGMKLDRDQVADLAAALGLGASSQVVESFARRLLGGVARQVGGTAIGGMLGGLAGTAAGAVLSFSTTYALGHAAERYYSSGRAMDKEELRALFERLQKEAKTLYPRVEQEIREQAEKLDADALLAAVRGVRG